MQYFWLRGLFVAIGTVIRQRLLRLLHKKTRHHIFNKIKTMTYIILFILLHILFMLIYVLIARYLVKKDLSKKPELSDFTINENGFDFNNYQHEQTA